MLGMEDVVQNPETCKGTKFACFYETLCSPHGRCIDIVMRRHTNPTSKLCGHFQLKNSIMCLRDGLLKKYVLARFQACDCVGNMMLDRRQYVDCAHIRA